MSDVSQLFEDLDRAARANDQTEFDRLERDLLSRFDGGFAGMPREIYDRYLEVDRSWPSRVTARPGARPGRRGGVRRGAGRPVGPLGPKLPLNARVPESLYVWLNEVGAVTGRNRSEALSECLQIVRDDEKLEDMLLARLRRDGDAEGSES